MNPPANVVLPYRIQHYLTEIGSHDQYVRDFRTYGHQTHTILRFTPDIDPCIIIERFIETQLARAIANARRYGHEPYWVGVAFRAEGGQDFLVKWRHTNENNAGRIIGEFEKFHQSARRLELADRPVHLRITIVGDHRGAGYKGKVPSAPPAYDPDAIIPVPARKDNLCLPVSIAIAIANTETVNSGNRVRKATMGVKRLLENPIRQVEQARAMLCAAGIRDDLPDYGRDEIQKIQQYFNSKMPGKYSIIVFASDSAKHPIFKGPTNAEHFLTLFLHDGHYDVAKSPAKLFGKRNYCVHCEDTYEKARDHSYSCLNRCHDCLGKKQGIGRVCEAEEEVNIRCNDCGVTFYNRQCYNHHKKSVACKTFAKCSECDFKYRRRNGHTCGETYCCTCNQPMQHDHQCHIQKMSAPIFVNYRVITWDVETDQSSSDGEHRVNTLCARIACRDCIENGRWKDKDYNDCPACGPDRCKVWTEWNDGDPVDSFLNHITTGLPKGYNTYAFSHNGAKFDNHFLMQKLFERGGEGPDIRALGNKIFQLKLKKSKVVNDDVYFRDSYMIMNMALEKVPDALGFNDPGLEKMFFPYLFNRKENYHRQLTHLPNHKFYLPATMSKEKRRKFKCWYKENRQQPFELCEALVEYCTSDVDILMEAMARLHSLVKELAGGTDLLPTFTTLAGLCQRLYRLMHYNLDDQTPLAAFTETGYNKLDRQSAIAMKWLKWFGHAHNVNVQHRDTPKGEKRLNNYKVDGFIPMAERNSAHFKFCDDPSCTYCREDASKVVDTVLEFHGCAYHGCSDCFPSSIKCPNGKTSDENYHRTKKKITRLQENHHVIEMWECKMKELLKRKECSDMKTFFDACIDTGPLDPREAFYGGRTGPSSLRFKKKKGYKIKYFDVCSLYPHVMRKEYPIGHPSCLARLGDAGFVSGVSWMKAADNPYRGVVKVRVIPPKQLAHPVLPVKHADRLVFPLCRKCMEGSVDCDPHREPGCNHCDEERSWIGTYFTDELNVALNHGYHVDMLIEAWHWNDDKWTDKHFKGYVNTFVRMKTEASGWKKEILEAEYPEKANDEFIEAYRRQGIHLRKDKIKVNPGKKTLSKDCANNLWGRFGLRANMSKAEVVSRPSRYYEMVDGPQYDVKDITIINQRLMRLSYCHKEEFHPSDPFGNVVVALITAAYGRMELFKYIEMADERMKGPVGSRVHYTDTDSQANCSVKWKTSIPTMK